MSNEEANRLNTPDPSLPPSGKGFSFKKKLVLFILFSFVCIGLAGVWITYKWYQTEQSIWLAQLPSYEQIKQSFVPSDQMMVDRSGFPLGTRRINSHYRSTTWISLSHVSTAFTEQLTQTEDQRFNEHHGVDWFALNKAGINWLLNQVQGKMATRGASTITMQLVGLLANTPNLATPSQKNLLKLKQKNKHNKRRAFSQKIDQMAAAQALEQQWTKSQILETYMNLIPFRGEIIGVETASQTFFNKSASALSQEESAFLIAQIRSPNANRSQLQKRMCQILIQSPPPTNLDSCLSQWGPTVQAWVDQSYHIQNERNELPVFSEKIASQKQTETNNPYQSTLKTTLDRNIQRWAIEALREQITTLKEQHVNDGAVLILDNKTGEVLAYVANAGERWTSASFIDGIQTKRQAGSTLKPFIYGVALESKLINENSLVEDTPIDIPVGQGQIYHPQNYDHEFKGVVSVSDALASSLNIPAIKMLMLAGEKQVISVLKKAGFTDLREGDFYGPSLALGTLDVSLWELTHAYQLLSQTQNRSLFSQPTKKTLFNMLSESDYRHWTFGTDSLLSLPFPAAVKTGTSKDMRDNWCVGWSSRYTVGVWIGNFDGSPMWQVSGMSGAAPIWRKLMLQLHPHFSVKTTANNKTPHNKVNVLYQPIPNKKISRIRYPKEGTIIAIDPDIPAANQALSIEIENPQTNDRLVLDGVLLGPSQAITFSSLSSLEKGTHQLTLQDQNGTPIEQVQFEIR